MRLENISKRCYQHSYLDEKRKIVILNLMPGENKEIPDDVARQWLKSGEVRVFVDPEEAKAKEDALKAENEKLKKQIAESIKEEAKTKKATTKKNGKHK